MHGIWNGLLSSKIFVVKRRTRQLAPARGIQPKWISQTPILPAHPYLRFMLTRSQGGFTTCIVLRVAPQGAVTVANAGHLAPYLAGQEIAVENGFPLGITAEADYPEVTIQLPIGAQLTLCTDGVVEARARSGELFGFDRAAALSMQPAEVVAETAQSFGQDDDITVLTVSLEASAHLPETALGSLPATALLEQGGIQ